MDIKHWDHGECPKYDCKKDACKCGLKKVFLASALGDDSYGSPIAPKNGAYCNAIVVYEANEHVYIYTSEGVPVLVGGAGGDLDKIEQEIKDMQKEIEDLRNSPDVVDIVATYAALQAYDTSSLGDKDVVRVLADATHDGQSTYYRWSKNTSTWTYIGAAGDYYTKSQVDTLLNGKQATLTFDSTPTANSSNPVTSDGIKSYVDTIVGDIASALNIINNGGNS